MEVGSTIGVLRIEAVPTLTIEEVFTVEAITTVTAMVMVVVTMVTPELASSTTTTGALVVSLVEAKGPLPWEQVQASWEVPWQVWLPCQCIIDTECTKACCFMEAMVGTMDMGMDTIPMVGMVIEECWSMSMIALEVVPCKLFVTMVSAGAGLVMMLGMANVGKTSTPSTTMTGMTGRALDLIPTNPVAAMMCARTLT